MVMSNNNKQVNIEAVTEAATAEVAIEAAREDNLVAIEETMATEVAVGVIISTEEAVEAVLNTNQETIEVILITMIEIEMKTLIMKLHQM